MKEQIISFECAKLAKEAGFPQIINNCEWYNKYGELTNKPFGEYILAPTQSLLQKWIREEHNIDIDIKTRRLIEHEFNSIYTSIVIHQIMNETIFIQYDVIFFNYEGALESGIKEALKLILKKA